MKKQIISFSEYKERSELVNSNSIGSTSSTQKFSFFKRKRDKKQKEATKKFPSFFWLGERLKIDGFNQARLLTEFLASGIKVFEVDKKSTSVMEVAIGQKDLSKASSLLEKLGYTFEVIKRVNPKSIGQFFLSKVALCVAVVLAFVAFGYAYGYVWRVEITGYDLVAPEWVERQLIDAGFGVGVRKSRHDLREITAFLNDLGDLLDSTVEIVGTTLRVDIVERTIYLERPSGSVDGIFSNFDATITRIDAISGTPQVDIGSRVFRGANLIAAHHVDTQGNIHPSVARGQVFGNVTFTDSVRFSTVVSTREPTGEIKKASRVSMFGIPFRAVVSPFENADFTTTYYYPFDNFFIPLKLQRTIVTEMAWVQREYILEEKIAELKQTALLDRLPQIGDSELTQTYIVEELGLNSNGNPEFILHSFISAELLIGSI